MTKWSREDSLGLVGLTLGSYRVLSLLGEGGMGAVFLAEHTAIGRKAAIKVLHPEFAVKPQLVKRFFNEARAANLVDHPSIVDIYDYGHSEKTGAFIVMEYLQGESLAQRLEREGSLSVENATRIVTRVAHALNAAHGRGLVHRDLKPDNIFLVPDPDHPGEDRVKVLDFGIAKLVEGEIESGVHTRTGTVIGTPAYMSPEQCHGAKEIDHRTDIYALGIIAFELLAGRPPYVGAGAGQIFVQHMTQQPPSLKELNPLVPSAVEGALLQALAKEPDDRFDTMAAFSTAMRAAINLPDTVEAIPRAEKTALGSPRGTGDPGAISVQYAPTLATPVPVDSGERPVSPATSTPRRQSTLSASAVEMSVTAAPRRMTRYLAAFAVAVGVIGVGVTGFVLVQGSDGGYESLLALGMDDDSDRDDDDDSDRADDDHDSDRDDDDDDDGDAVASKRTDEDPPDVDDASPGKGDVGVDGDAHPVGTGKVEDAAPKLATPKLATASIVSAPRGATVFEIRGPKSGLKRVGVTPWKGETPETGEKREFLLRLKGYRDSRVTLTKSEDWTRSVKLTPKPRGKPAATKVGTGDAYDPELPD